MTDPDRDAYLDALAEARQQDRDADLAADLDRLVDAVWGDHTGTRAEGLR